MEKFGALLRAYRLQCIDPLSGRLLTQERLAELLGYETGVESYSGSTISNWERGVNQVRRDARDILVSLIKVLHLYGGITTSEESNQLLLAGNYRSLDNEELELANPAWKQIKIRGGEDSLFPSVEHQEALLPTASYTRLFGVDAIKEQVTQLLLDTKAPYLLALVGLGGTGKTAIADNAVRHILHQRAYAQVVWVSIETEFMHPQETAGNHSLFQTVIHTIFTQLFPEQTGESNVAKELTKVRLALKQHRYLVIIDNLESAPALNHLLSQLSKLTRPSKFLITARHHPSPETEIYTLPVPELTCEQATNLLQYQAKISGVVDVSQLTDDHLAEIYQVIGGNPLALRFIPRLIRMQPFTQMLAGWREGKFGYADQVYTSIYALLWQTLSPNEKQILHIMMPLTHVGATAKQLQSTSDLSRADFWSALMRLIESCLVEPRGVAHKKRYGIHSLTRHFIQSQIYTEWPQAEMVLQQLAYWQGFLSQLPAKQWYLIDAERSNIFQAIQLSLALSEQEITSTVRRYWLTLSEQLFRFIEQRGYAAEWIPLLEHIVEHTDDDPLVQCQLLNRLGALYRLVLQLDAAITMHQRALSIAQELNINEKTAHSYLNLGIDYRHSKQYDRAFQNGKHALDIFTQLSLTARGTAASLNLLGQVSDAQGDQEQSAHYLQKAASIWREEQYLPELARTLNNLARVYETQKQFDKAFSCYTEAKHALTRTNSELDVTLICLSEGTLRFNLAQYAEASTVFKRIDLVYLENAGHWHYLALALNNLGSVAQVQEKYDRAEAYLRKSLRLWQKMGTVQEITDTETVLNTIKLEKKKKADQQNADQP